LRAASIAQGRAREAAKLQKRFERARRAADIELRVGAI